MNEPMSDWIAVTRVWGADLEMHHTSEPLLLERAEVEAVAFVIVETGRARLEVGDERVELTAGEAVLLPSGAAHRVQLLPVEAGSSAQQVPTTLLLGRYEGSRCPVTSMWAGCASTIYIDAEAMLKVPQAPALTALIVGELRAPGHGSEPMIGSLLDALMVTMLRAITSSTSGNTWLQGLEDPVVGPALQAIHHAPSDAWTIHGLAKVAGVSRSLFAKRFSDRMSETPMEYVRRFRMSLAVRLMLSDESIALESVAQQVGYESQYAFSRAFKRVVGEPPGQFRRQMTG